MNLFEKAAKLANGIKVLTEWIGSGGHTVQASQAQSRADICNKCPCNSHTVGATGKVAEAIKSQLEIKNALQLRVVGEKKLGTCDVCCCALRLKVWVPIDRIRPQPGDNFPAECWVKQETA